MSPVQELSDLANRLTAAAAKGDLEDVVSPLKAMDEAAVKISRAFCGSWIGYHSRVYYEGLQPPPPGANFSQEWGLYTRHGTRGDWREFDPEEVKSAINVLANNPDLEPARAAATAANLVFNKAKAEALSIVELEIAEAPDPSLDRVKNELERLEPLSGFEIAKIWSPNGPTMSRDTLAWIMRGGLADVA